ncbi:hypothetical protein [Streptomyces sp. NBC_00691]|uniref:hypothetical protein n=1 Tax=Streptomyces sp. NBC_00691 TaxID=2903671 RepID=UPI002E369397|nr:hypothetical protein [Streptomyces sp. NBC_00691]
MAEQDTSAPALFDVSALTPTFMDLRDPEYAYMFGFLQADGHLSRGTGQKGRLTAEINVRDIAILRVSLTTASTAIGAYLCHYAKKVTGAERMIRRNARDGIYNVLYTKEAAVLLAEHLYYPGCLALERKKSAAASLTSWVRPPGMKVRPPRRPWTAAEDRVLLAAPTPAHAAAKLGRSRKSCQVRRWRLVNGIATSTTPRSL